MDQHTLLRKIPKIDDLMMQIETVETLKPYSQPMKTAQLRIVIQSLREEILAESNQDFSLERLQPESIIAVVTARCRQLSDMQLRRVINGTGVVLHTNLGRAPLGDYVREALLDIATGYSNLELDLNSGKRGSRYDHMKELLIELTGAEDAMIVNNNAGAVMLVLSALTKNREVIISRGELVEIGGSFRIPEVMEQSGAVLVEVGATNKAYIRDYEAAVTEKTGAFLKVHQSNFKMMGFTHEVTPEDLVALGKKHELPVINDLGSGLLIDLTPYGFPKEPTVTEAIAAGCDVVTFSGDKLLGGAQAGIIAGNKKWIRQIAKHPLTRALRVDKLTLCALEATLKLYLNPEKALKQIPALKMMTETAEALEERAVQLQQQILAVMGEDSKLTIDLVTDTSQVGGGAYPTVELESRLIRFSAQPEVINELERFLRNHQPALIGRIQAQTYLIDLRTLFDEDFQLICEALQHWKDRE